MERSKNKKNKKSSRKDVCYLTNAEADVTEGWSVEILLK